MTMNPFQRQTGRSDDHKILRKAANWRAERLAPVLAHLVKDHTAYIATA